ncbi:MAG: polysaccharide pyruvyl transferase family protein [Roseburia faecis]
MQLLWGSDRYDGSDEDKKIVKTLLKRFDGISVRETESVSLCKKEFDLDIVRNLDPVFLCKQEHYDMLAKESQIQVDENIIWHIYLILRMKRKWLYRV